MDKGGKEVKRKSQSGKGTRKEGGSTSLGRNSQSYSNSIMMIQFLISCYTSYTISFGKAFVFHLKFCYINKRRKQLEKKKLAEVPPTALQNNLVMMAAKRAQEIQDAEDAEREGGEL
jgi:hypothetical protein